MNLVAPIAGLILAAALIPPLIILYIMKLRRRPIAIASTMLWKRSVEDLRANAPFQKLRASVLLFLQLLALLLLAFSIMQPQVLATGASAGKTVLLIDNSASMLTIDDPESGETRLDRAKELARERIDALYAGGLFESSTTETMIIAFADGAEVMSRFSTSRQALLSAIDNIRPTHGESNLGEALKLSRAYTTNVDPDSDRPLADPAALELFSDGHIHDLADQVRRRETLDYYRIGADEADNIATVSVNAQRPYDRPSMVEVFTSLVNFNPRDVTCDLQLEVDDAIIALQSVEIPAATIDDATGALIPTRRNVVFVPFELARGALIQVTNLREDALMVDNAARAVVPPPKQLTVALVGAQTNLVQSALEGLPLKELIRLTTDQFIARAAEGRTDAYDVIVFDHIQESVTELPPGRYLTLGGAPPVEGLNDYGSTRDQILLSTRDEHPIFRFVAADDLVITEARLMEPDDDVQVLAEGSQGPIVVEVSRGGLRMIHLGFDPLDSNWPFDRSFVTFIFNVIDYLGHFGEQLTERGLTPGSPIATRIPEAATDVEIETPDGMVVPLTVLEASGGGGAAISWGPARHVGTYTLRWSMPGRDEPMTRRFAVNLASEREGFVVPVNEIRIGAETIDAAEESLGRYTPLWPYAIALCLVVLMVEWWIYTRKAHV